jgi:universal stress protein A
MIQGFKEILLPFDFSAQSARAAEYAEWVARLSGARVHLAHVIANPADALYEPQQEPNWVLVEHAKKKAASLLETAAQESFPTGCPCEVHVAVGDPYQKLMELARRIKPDLIVMSTHGRGGVAHLVIGSVAEKVIRHAPCPVFVIRQREIK